MAPMYPSRLILRTLANGASWATTRPAREGHIRTEASPGAARRSVLEERDGWYIASSGFGCGRPAAVGAVFLTTSSFGRQDWMHFKRLGTAPTGFPIEETTTRTEAGTIHRHITRRVAASTGPNPKTLTNRVEVWWTDLTWSLQ